MPTPLSQDVIDEALEVAAGGCSTEPIGRAVINGSVVIYNHQDPPAWLVPILAERNEAGDIAP